MQRAFLSSTKRVCKETSYWSFCNRFVTDANKEEALMFPRVDSRAIGVVKQEDIGMTHYHQKATSLRSMTIASLTRFFRRLA